MILNDVVLMLTDSAGSFYDGVNVRVYAREGLQWKALNETKSSEGLERKARPSLALQGEIGGTPKFSTSRVHPIFLTCIIFILRAFIVLWQKIA